MVLPELAQLQIILSFFFLLVFCQKMERIVEVGEGDTIPNAHTKYFIFWINLQLRKQQDAFCGVQVSTLTKLHYNHIFQFPFQIFKIYFAFKGNCFTILCRLLPCNNANQSPANTCPLPPEALPSPLPPSTPLDCPRAMV